MTQDLSSLGEEREGVGLETEQKRTSGADLHTLGSGPSPEESRLLEWIADIIDREAEFWIDDSRKCHVNNSPMVAYAIIKDGPTREMFRNILTPRAPQFEALWAVADSAAALRRHLRNSVNAGPLTNNPTREAMILRALYSSLDAVTQVGTPASETTSGEAQPHTPAQSKDTGETL